MENNRNIIRAALNRIARRGVENALDQARRDINRAMREYQTRCEEQGVDLSAEEQADPAGRYDLVLVPRHIKEFVTVKSLPRN